MKLFALIFLTLLSTTLIMGWLTRGLHNVRIVSLIAWYDMWIGFFWDAKKRWFGFIVKFK